MPLLEGYLIGLSLILLIGPVLFVLLYTSLEGGRAQGLSVAFGIFISDVIAVLLCALGFEAWLKDPVVEPWLALGGGLLLLSFGAQALLKPQIKPPERGAARKLSLLSAFSRGFLVNFVNPFVFMVWIGILALGSARHSGWGLAAFMSGCLLGILTLDILKVLLAERIQRHLSAARLKWIIRGSALLLLAFGLRLLLLSARMFAI